MAVEDADRKIFRLPVEEGVIGRVEEPLKRRLRDSRRREQIPAGGDAIGQFRQLRGFSGERCPYFLLDQRKGCVVAGAQADASQEVSGCEGREREHDAGDQQSRRGLKWRP